MHVKYLINVLMFRGFTQAMHLNRAIVLLFLIYFLRVLLKNILCTLHV